MSGIPLKLKDERVEWRQVEGEIVALDLQTSRYIAINRAGAILWPLLVGGTTHERLKQRLQEEFGIDETTAGKDVEAFLSALVSQDLLDR